MSEQQKQMIGIVVRADGTMPFDEDVAPYVRAHILAHLSDHGHTLEPVHGTKHVRIKDWQKGQRIEKH